MIFMINLPIGQLLPFSCPAWFARSATIDWAVRVPIIATALFVRFASRQRVHYAGNIVAAPRREFESHAIRAAGGIEP